MNNPCRNGQTSVWLVDTTLRDGEQAPGVCFTPQARVRLARRLSEARIDELELCVAAREGAGWDEPIRLRDSGVACRLSSWCRLREDDVATALRTAVECIHIAVPASELQLKNVGLGEAQVIARLERCLDRVVNAGRIASIGAVDGSRSSSDWLLRLVELAERGGASRFRVADTVGRWEPFVAHDVIEALCRNVSTMVIGVHTHNDLGLASANALAAVRAGARSVDVTVNGLGERAGNAALEQIAVALKTLGIGTCNLELTRLPELCALVAEMSRRDIAPGAPVVGSQAFRHSSGIHVAAVLKEPRAFEGFAPEICGRERQVRLDAHSGRHAVRAVLRGVGFEPTERECLELRRLLRQQGEQKGEVGGFLAQLDMVLRATGRAVNS